MKWVPKILLLFAFVTGAGFKYMIRDDSILLTGAWQLQAGPDEHVLLFADGYYTHSSYNKATKKFGQTSGGRYTEKNGQVELRIEFHTEQKDKVGQTISSAVTVKDGLLSMEINGKKETWKRIDDGKDNLAGLWHITARKQDDKLVPIHQTGPRKTVKILTGSRFQWAAINPETKEFFGTGGGTYSFKSGTYTENIEFFSRDSSRVGAALQFDGRLENGNWHHSGLSSKGDKIYEVWSRVK